MKAGYSILDHPADMGIEACAATIEEAFEQAAEALISIILDPSRIECEESREVTIDAIDIEHLLVKWLSEILYLYDGERFVVGRFHVDELNDTHLKARLLGEKFFPSKHSTKLDVKAITYHQLQIDRGHDGVRVRVFLDI